MTDPLTTIRIALATGEGVDEAFGACDALEAEQLTPEEASIALAWLDQPMTNPERAETATLMAKLERRAGDA